MHKGPRGTEAVESNHVVAFTQNTRDEVRYINGDGQITGALAASSGMKQTNYVVAFNKQRIGEYSDSPVASTVCARGYKEATDLVAFSSKDYGADAMNDYSPTLRAGGHNGSHANAGVPPAVAFTIGAGAQAGSTGLEEEVSPTLTSTDSGTQRSPGLLRYSAVRRLTPVECERLQGFPDNFTAIPWRNKPADQCPDGPWYKALGNSMAVPVMRWIGERIQMVDALVSVL